MIIIALARINQFVWIIPIIVGIMNQKYLTFLGKLLLGGLVGTILIEVYASFLAFQVKSNLMVYSLFDYYIALLVGIGLIIIIRNTYLQILYFCFIGMLFFVFHYYHQQPTYLGGYDMLVIYLLNTFICVIRIQKLTNETNVLFGNSEFWILSGLIIYFFSTSVLFYLYKYSKGIESFHLIYHTVYLFFCLATSAILFTKAMLCKPKATTY